MSNRRNMPHATRRPMMVIALLLGLVGARLAADEIALGDFPPGQWLDTNWHAYWTFGDKSIRLLDVKDAVIWDFAGIVTNQKTVTLKDGSIRYTFDCPKAGRSYAFERVAGTRQLRMTIRRDGQKAEYAMDLPVISAQQLVVYKQAIISGQTDKVAELVASIDESPSGTNATQAVKEARELDRATDQLLALAAQADFDGLEKAFAAADAEGQTARLVANLESLAARPDAPPSVWVALSLHYGRTGFKSRQYNALEQAEQTPIPPGMNFNLALVHGRKQMLANGANAADFMIGDIEASPDVAGATVILDGEPKGTSPLTINKVETGWHKVELKAPGYKPYSVRFELGVGGYQRVMPNMVAMPVLEVRSGIPGTVWLGTERALGDVTPEAPFITSELSDGEYTIRLVTKNGTDVPEQTVSLKGGTTTTLVMVDIAGKKSTKKPGPDRIRAVFKVITLPLNGDSCADTGNENFPDRDSPDAQHKTSDIFNDKPLGFAIDVIIPFKDLFYAKAGFLSSRIEGVSEGTGPYGTFTTTDTPSLTWNDIILGTGLAFSIADRFTVQGGVDAFIGLNKMDCEVIEANGEGDDIGSPHNFAAQAGVELTFFVTRHIPISVEVNYIFTKEIWLHGLSYGVGIGYAF